MKKINFSFRSFQAKITLVLIISMLFIGAMSNFLIYKFALNAQFSGLRDKLMVIAQTAALIVDAEALMQVPLDKEGVNSPQYKSIAEKLEAIRQVNLPIKYIYTLTKTGQPGIWQFIVDPDAVADVWKRGGIVSFPGDKYNAARFPEMLKAFDGPCADKKLEIDEWGITLSGYAPVRDKAGRAAAILGVDILADDVYLTQKEVHRRAIFVLSLGIGLSVILGMLISRRIAKPVKRLVEGTRYISEGNLQYRVDVIGADEIGELGEAFNQMARSLFESRKKLLGYFYHTVQSFVRILEAKDHYTRGHSERVAEYAEKIALRMNLPKEKVELLRETALLHDIGKIGVLKSVLDKKEKLSEEEWETIRRHPVVGEDILRPVLLTKEMLAVVRGHHERYDSKGYPDKISGENINIFTAIVSVADAYDAMTSPRAYRPAMSKQEAIAELNKNKGAQFNPKVVDVFLEIMEKDS